MRVYPALVVLVCLLVSVCCHAATIPLPGGAITLQGAIDAAEAGDTVRLGVGRFEGKVVVDKPLTIIGAGMDETTICCGTDDGDVCILAEEDLTLRNLTVGPAYDGVVAGENVALRLTRVRLADAKSDGAGFRGGFQTRLFMRKCEVTRCGDGVDLESTQGQAFDCDFHDNRDDGLDYDGDAGFLCVRCRFVDNGDDGIEVRLARTTMVLLTECTFSGNPEDNLELINTPELDPQDNVVAVDHCTFTGAGRWDLGCVDLLTADGKRNEETSVQRPHAAVFLCANRFSRQIDEAVSPNLRLTLDETGAAPEQVVVTWTPPGGEARQAMLVPSVPMLAGIVNVRPSFNGYAVGDAEGLAVDAACFYIGDDTNSPNTGLVHCFDRFTGAHIQTVSTNPFTGSYRRFTGPEGLTVLRDGGLLVLDDMGDHGADGIVLTPGPTGFGRFVRYAPMPEPTHVAEGIAIVGEDTIYLPERETIGLKAARLSDATVLPGWPVEYLFDGKQLHMAGVGYDGANVLVTVTAYPAKPADKPQPANYIMKVDPADGRPVAIEWIGAYCNDARGVDHIDGFTMVSDGWSHRKHKDGWVNKQGQKVYIFANAAEAISAAADRLPVRHLPEE